MKKHHDFTGTLLKRPNHKMIHVKGSRQVEVVYINQHEIKAGNCKLMEEKI